MFHDVLCCQYSSYLHLLDSQKITLLYNQLYLPYVYFLKIRNRLSNAIFPGIKRFRGGQRKKRVGYLSSNILLFTISRKSFFIYAQIYRHCTLFDPSRHTTTLKRRRVSTVMHCVVICFQDRLRNCT